MARKRRTVEASQTSIAIEPVMQETPVVLAVVPPAPIELPPQPAPARVCRWLVKNTMRVSLYGHLTYIHEGTVVALSEYGPAGIERLREQNVVLEPMV